MLERIDKIFASCGVLSRSECLSAVKKKKISVNGEIVKSPSQKADIEKDVILFENKPVKLEKFVYIMLNKPFGVVSASSDGNFQTVVDILPENFKRKGLFPCGRLDKDTVGLIIITNDGVSAHKRLAPKTHAEKVYYFETAEAVSNLDAEKIEKGVLLKDGYITAPSKVKLLTDKSGEITLTEGKYHEIKRIFGSLGNKITFLKRISFADIKLDESLAYGEARYLTEKERGLFTK
ncbi:MAG: rRNA pseudouridine synthase [Clostridia bacterium]|nr:rRNA pseudouridine synthase [Clostridia bacterium]